VLIHEVSLSELAYESQQWSQSNKMPHVAVHAGNQQSKLIHGSHHTLQYE